MNRLLREMISRGAGFASLGEGPAEDAVLVAGTGRSGTTWVGGVLAAVTGSRPMFEPFVSDRRGGFYFRHGPLREDFAERDRPVSIPEGAGADHPLHGDIEQALEGRVHDPWVGAQGFWRRRRVIKEIRANLFLGHILAHWPGLRVIHLVRNPEDVVASMLRMSGRDWRFDLDVGSLLKDDALLRDHLAPMEEALRRTDSHTARLAHRWCLENFVALRQTANRAGVLRVGYDTLANNPGKWETLRDFLHDLPWSRRTFEAMAGRPSATSDRKDGAFGNGSRSRSLPEGERKIVLDVVRTWEENCGVDLTGLARVVGPGTPAPEA